MDLKTNNKIENSINKGAEYLVNNQHDDGSLYLEDDKRWTVWETANAIISINQADKNKKLFLKKAINFLLKCQREDGSFFHAISFEKDDYCMETTAECLLALAIVKKDIKKGIQFMLNKQNIDGSWEIGTPGIIKRRSWPSIAGFVLNALLCLGASSNQISKGIEFLLKKQHDDGSWGSNWIYYDTPYYPTFSILSALKQYNLIESDSYKRAVNFIKKNQNPDGSWGSDITDKPRPSKSLRTALALNSLLISPFKSDFKSIENGINWLLNVQESDGCWDGGYFVNWPGKKEDIYTTSLAIYAIKKYGHLIKE